VGDLERESDRDRGVCRTSLLTRLLHDAVSGSMVRVYGFWCNMLRKDRES
jgi:hypothetical protein